MQIIHFFKHLADLYTRAFAYGVFSEATRPRQFALAMAHARGGQTAPPELRDFAAAPSADRISRPSHPVLSGA
jgi:hypothetical protein